MKEIREIIKKIKSSNSRGNSEITSRNIKTLINYMSAAITHLTNRIYCTGIYPEALKIARVLPIKKQGKDEDKLESFIQ